MQVSRAWILAGVVATASVAIGLSAGAELRRCVGPDGRIIFTDNESRCPGTEPIEAPDSVQRVDRGAGNSVRQLGCPTIERYFEPGDDLAFPAGIRIDDRGRNNRGFQIVSHYGTSLGIRPTRLFGVHAVFVYPAAQIFIREHLPGQRLKQVFRIGVDGSIVSLDTLVYPNHACRPIYVRHPECDTNDKGKHGTCGIDDRL